MSLSEIVAEGKRLHAEHDAATMLYSLKTAKRLTAFYAEHGPRLLAVAEAAVEFDTAESEYAADCDGGSRASWRLFRAREVLRKLVRGAAFDAAAQGGEK